MRLRLAAYVAALTFHPGWLLADCEALIRLPEHGGLWIAKADGALVRRLTAEDVILAAWSPDGKYVVWTSEISEIGIKRVGAIGLTTRDGRQVSRRRNESSSGTYETGLRWVHADMFWLRGCGHAACEVTFWRVPASLDLKHAQILGRYEGDACAVSPDSSSIACVEAGHVSLAKPGGDLLTPSKRIYPPSPFTSKNQRGSIDVGLNRIVHTPTDPAFEVEVSRESSKPVEGKVWLSTAPPNGNARKVYVRADGGNGLIDLPDADWWFVLRRVDSNRARFRVTIYRDDSKRELFGVAWSPDGSRILTWETARHNDGLLVLRRIDNNWSADRFASRGPSAVSGVRFDSKVNGAVVETAAGATYRCDLDTKAACSQVPSHNEEHLDIRRDGDIVRADVLDWRCVSTRN